MRTIMLAALLFAGSASPQPAPASGHGANGPIDHSTMDHASIGQHMPARNAMLSASRPADGATLAAAPPAVSLTFAHAVTLATATLLDAGGRETALDIAEDAAPAATVSVNLPAIAKGAYRLRYATGGGHAMTGEIAFTIR